MRILMGLPQCTWQQRYLTWKHTHPLLSKRIRDAIGLLTISTTFPQCGHADIFDTFAKASVSLKQPSSKIGDIPYPALSSQSPSPAHLKIIVDIPTSCYWQIQLLPLDQEWLHCTSPHTSARKRLQGSFSNTSQPTRQHRRFDWSFKSKT